MVRNSKVAVKKFEKIKESEIFFLDVNVLVHNFNLLVDENNNRANAIDLLTEDLRKCQELNRHAARKMTEMKGDIEKKDDRW